MVGRPRAPIVRASEASCREEAGRHLAKILQNLDPAQPADRLSAHIVAFEFITMMVATNRGRGRPGRIDHAPPPLGVAQLRGYAVGARRAVTIWLGLPPCNTCGNVIPRQEARVGFTTCESCALGRGKWS